MIQDEAEKALTILKSLLKMIAAVPNTTSPALSPL